LISFEFLHSELIGFEKPASVFENHHFLIAAAFFYNIENGRTDDA